MPTLKCVPLPMRYVGKNGSMGLVTGRTYQVVIYTNGTNICARWGDNPGNTCPYETLKTLTDNWVSDVY